MLDQSDPQIVSHYESFINDTLKEDLKIIEERLQKINSEIAEFIQIKKSLEVLQNEEIFKDGFKTQVDIGCNFYIQAKVSDPSTMLFDIGLNHYLEFSKPEALKYIDARIKALEEVSESLIQKSAETKAHIKLMLFHIGELQNINKS